MAKINSNYLKLKAGYLFPEISRRVQAFTEKNPDAKVLKLGIGDVTRALPPAIIEAFHQGVDEMAKDDSFKGYGPEQGYAFLRDLIAKNDYQDFGLDVRADEIFVSDGSKCDTGNIQELFSPDSIVAVSDPVYPVYVDTNVMAGRSQEVRENGQYEGLVYMPCTEENGFIPPVPETRADVIYLCSPNNPTGTVMTHNQLKAWVDYAKENQAVILYDAAYEAFITDDQLPHSIYEIEGAREVAIEFRSYSKNAGFTGTRCGFSVVPKDLMAFSDQGDKVPLWNLWNRRQSTKFNGVSYPVQKAAAAVYSEKGKKEVKDLVAFYLENARILNEALTALGFKTWGGVNAPYVWVKNKNGGGSWDLFDTLLEETHLVGTPGSGFGPSGEGYFRFSAFGQRETINEAVKRLKAHFS